jgi:hypothetical protein
MLVSAAGVGQAKRLRDQGGKLVATGFTFLALHAAEHSRRHLFLQRLAARVAAAVLGTWIATTSEYLEAPVHSRLQTLNLVPLRRAVFCVNCETISDSGNGVCAVCGSPSLINVSRLLGGPEAEPGLRRADPGCGGETG